MSVTTRISVRELEVIAQKALKAAGVALGLDRDGAFSAVWQEERGLDGLAMLIRDLDALSGVPTRLGGTIDAKGLSAFIVAPLAIDLAMVLGGDLTVKNLRSPLATIPYAVRRAFNGRWFKITWAENEVLTVNGEAAIACVKSDVASIMTVVSGKNWPPTPPAVAVTAVELEQRRFKALMEGLVISSYHREVLLELASRILVPASDNSRSGAGAEVDDNE